VRRVVDFDIDEKLGVVEFLRVIRHKTRDDALPFMLLMESDPLMPLLQSENPNLVTESLASGLPVLLKEFREKLFTLVWAIAALAATFGWFYLIARMAYYFFN
jgi:hypothetical protein